jgi:uncharacterized protein DUF4190
MSFTPPGDEQAGPPPTPPPAPPVPGWWLASDGNWYPPQAAPGGAMAPTPYGPPRGAPYGYSPYAPTQGTNGLAIASLVLGIIWIYWIGSVLALIFGFIALGQINQSGGRQGGRGLAVAGIICAFAWIALLVIAIIAVAADS